MLHYNQCDMVAFLLGLWSVMIGLRITFTIHFGVKNGNNSHF
nr:MAG TPA: hypothetical protein [Caudoviricetes sp.]